MSDVQKAIDFVMANRAFFGFLAMLAGYIASKVKSARKDERIDKQQSALEGVARGVEEFQGLLNQRDPSVVDDPKALKKTIAYRVSRGREELDEAIAKLKGDTRGQETAGRVSRAVSAAKAILP
jgi:hypothetical protein